MVGTAATTISIQSAQAVQDPNERSARLFAPGVINKVPGSVDENAPKAFQDPNEVGDPDQIGDPNSRAPGLLVQR